MSLPGDRRSVGSCCSSRPFSLLVLVAAMSIPPMLIGCTSAEALFSWPGGPEWAESSLPPPFLVGEVVNLGKRPALVRVTAEPPPPDPAPSDQARFEPPEPIVIQELPVSPPSPPATPAAPSLASAKEEVVPDRIEAKPPAVETEGRAERPPRSETDTEHPSTKLSDYYQDRLSEWSAPTSPRPPPLAGKTTSPVGESAPPPTLEAQYQHRLAEFY